MATNYTGGCQCGAVRYECNADAIFMGNCHCRDCQKASGSGYEAAIGVPAPALKITGNVKYHDVKADSGNMVSRGFCPNCGSRLFGKSSGMAQLAVIMAGSLDDPKQFQPGMDVYTSSAQPWDHMNPGLPKLPKMPM